MNLCMRSRFWPTWPYLSTNTPGGHEGDDDNGSQVIANDLGADVSMLQIPNCAFQATADDLQVGR